METYQEPLRLLLADDDEDDRDFFRDALHVIRLKTELYTAETGVQAMELLNAPGIANPHLIFLDLNMPNMNGRECLLQIRGCTDLSGIPVIIFSTSANSTDVDEAFRNGANLYVQKPPAFDKMVNILENVFQDYITTRLNNPTRNRFLLI